MTDTAPADETQTATTPTRTGMKRVHRYTLASSVPPHPFQARLSFTLLYNSSRLGSGDPLPPSPPSARIIRVGLRTMGQLTLADPRWRVSSVPWGCCGLPDSHYGPCTVGQDFQSIFLYGCTQYNSAIYSGKASPKPEKRRESLVVLCHCWYSSSESSDAWINWEGDGSHFVIL